MIIINTIMEKLILLPIILGFPIFFLFIWLIVFSLGIAGTVFWVLMLIDLLKRDFKEQDEKIIWLLVILFGNLIGAIIYFVMVKQKSQK